MAERRQVRLPLCEIDSRLLKVWRKQAPMPYTMTIRGAGLCADTGRQRRHPALHSDQTRVTMRASIDIDLGGTHLPCGSHAGTTPCRNVPVTATPPGSETGTAGAGEFVLGGW